MNKSESIANLAKALANLQKEITNPANTADNPFFKSKYAPLPDILNLVRPLLSKHGLSILQSPAGDGTNIVISTILMHNSGEWIEPEPLVLKADKATAQGAGSAITYGRRYALSAILGISSEDDDDGNHATGNNSTNNQSRNQQQKNNQPPTDKPKDEEPKEYKCSVCGTTEPMKINQSVYEYSTKKLGKSMCRDCQKKNAKVG